MQLPKIGPKWSKIFQFLYVWEMHLMCLPLHVSWGLMRACNPSKWKGDIWGGLLCFTKYIVNHCLHWACWQYGHSGETWGWLGAQRCQLCLQDTFCSAKWHRRAAVGHWISLCVVGWCCLCGGNILMARPSTFLESRSWWGHDCGKFILFTISCAGKYV